MPFKFETEKKKIPRDLKRTVKLSLQQREEIREKFKTWDYTKTKLAKEYDVSRRLILFIIYPEKEKENARQFLERQKDWRYYKKYIHNKQVKIHRQYKQSIKNKLI